MTRRSIRTQPTLRDLLVQANYFEKVNQRKVQVRRGAAEASLEELWQTRAVV